MQTKGIAGVGIKPEGGGGFGNFPGGQHSVCRAGCQFIQGVFTEQIRVFEPAFNTLGVQLVRVKAQQRLNTPETGKLRVAALNFEIAP